MQYISAYALASLSGKEPDADTLKNILKATGKPFNDKEVDSVVASLKGKNIQEGMSKVGSIGGSAPSSAPAKKEQKKKQQPKKPEPKKKEPQPVPEDDMDGPGDLFG